MKMKLSETVPWSDEDWGGFAISVVLAPILFVWLMSYSDGLLMRAVHMGLIMFANLVVMNSNPMRRMSGGVQYLACSVEMGVIRAASDPTTTFFEFFFYGAVFGFLVFCLIRVNWWFYWNNASRRTTLEKVLGSIFYTTLFPLGALIGFCRFIGSASTCRPRYSSLSRRQRRRPRPPLRPPGVSWKRSWRTQHWSSMRVASK